MPHDKNMNEINTKAALAKMGNQSRVYVAEILFSNEEPAYRHHNGENAKIPEPLVKVYVKLLYFTYYS